MKVNVLSLFDGISCGQVALERAGIEVDRYFASEINPCSIQITQKHFPNTIQLGNVEDIDFTKFKDIDLLIAGSPCENLSSTANDRPKVSNGLEGKKSSLFYKFVEALNIIKPKYFFLENVASMKDENKDIISNILGVEPIMIDSALMSAQDRKRYYWTNIPNIKQPDDKNIVLKDIMQTNVDEKYYYNKPYKMHGLDKKIVARLEIKTHDLLKKAYNPNFKCGTLTAVQGGYQEKKVFDSGRIRKLTPVEYERLQTLPDGYTEGFANSKRYSVCGDAWTVDVIAHIFSFMK